MGQAAENLLLVDDDEVVLATFGRGLDQAGFRVRLAGDGQEALASAREDLPDLAILDMRMPGLSGLETAAGLGELGVPVMFLSAYGDEDLVAQAVQGGSLGYLVKPVDVERAIPTIRAALVRGREMRALRDSHDRLEGAVETAREVNVVVGVLMERHRASRDEAFEMLRQRARSQRRKVRELAREMIQAWEAFN